MCYIHYNSIHIILSAHSFCFPYHLPALIDDSPLGIESFLYRHPV